MLETFSLDFLEFTKISTLIARSNAEVLQTVQSPSCFLHLVLTCGCQIRVTLEIPRY